MSKKAKKITLNGPDTIQKFRAMIKKIGKRKTITMKQWFDWCTELFSLDPHAPGHSPAMLIE